MTSTRLGGLDDFRVPAALLVIAIHTGPLLSMSPATNYLLTDILARLAVPFFFAVSGWFLLPRVQQQGMAALLPFLKKILILYSISACLYYPVKIYNHTFSWTSLPRELIFDGPFYHLWYFPALLLGTLLVCLSLRYLGRRGTAVLCAALYLFGLLGDSYYGLAQAIPPLYRLYEALFQCFDYTRNGLFFAPLFLLLGDRAGRNPPRHGPQRCWIGFGLGLAALIAEGLAVKHFNLARFDAFYLALPPCLYALLQGLRTLELPPRPGLRAWSGAVYILHPLCILLVRGFAKGFGQTALLVDQSLVHYAAVVGLSALLALPFALLRRRRPTSARSRAWIELDARALRHNLALLRERLPAGCTLMAVVKANAYGHGAVEIARLCAAEGVDAFAVATVQEGEQLRRAGIRGTILVLGYSGPELVPLLARCRLTQTVVSAEHAQLLDGCGRRLQVHLKLDTGMHRLGIPWNDAASLASIYACRNLKVIGTFTHLARAGQRTLEGEHATEEQLACFRTATERLRCAGFDPGALHVQSSYGLLNYPELTCAYVRLGIALYGSLSAPDDHTRLSLPLRPVLALRARVVQVHTLQPGETAGYDGDFIAVRPCHVAVLAIGYADGWPRCLSHGVGQVLLHSRPVPVAGLICMDQMLVDVTEVPNVRPGDIATLIGRDGDAELTAARVARDAGTIANELLSRLGSRVERILLP